MLDLSPIWQARCSEFGLSEIARLLVCSRKFFVIAVWRAKEADPSREVLGNHRPQYQETRLELGLCLSD
jgi:hypothetical protein